MRANFEELWFLNLVFAAQDGNVEARNQVVTLSLPCVFMLVDLRSTAGWDEAQDLVMHLIEYSIPKWNGATPWAVHLRVTLTSRLLTLRRERDRRRERGLGWL